MYSYSSSALIFPSLSSSILINISRIFYISFSVMWVAICMNDIFRSKEFWPSDQLSNSLIRAALSFLSNLLNRLSFIWELTLPSMPCWFVLSRPSRLALLRFYIQGCSRACLASSLFVGSRCRSLNSRSFASWDKCSNLGSWKILRSFFSTLLKISSVVWPGKGNFPATQTYMTTPRDQRSLAVVTTRLITSGAM